MKCQIKGPVYKKLEYFFCVYNKEWELQPDFKDWLGAVKSDRRKAFLVASWFIVFIRFYGKILLEFSYFILEKSLKKMWVLLAEP